MPVTMRDVARASGVSVGTVSSVINNRNRIGTETRERVLEQIRVLGYDPDRNLPRRPTVSTKSIGLVVPGSITEIHAGYYRAIIAAKQATADRNCGFRFHFETEVERMAVDLFHLGREQLDCDSLIVYCPNHNYDEYMRNISAWGIPMVLVRRQTTLDNVAVITNDSRKAEYELLDHLYGLGHRRIVCYGNTLNGNGKENIYRNYLKEKGMSVDDRFILNRQQIPMGPAERKRQYSPTDVTTEFYYSHPGLVKIMQGLLSEADAPTAVFCQADYLAVEMIKSLQAAGYRVPDDVSVVGMNDNPAATLFEPRITTTRMPVDEMICAACDVLSGDGKEHTKRKLIFDNTLIVRDSTDKARNADSDER